MQPPPPPPRRSGSPNLPPAPRLPALSGPRAARAEAVFNSALERPTADRAGYVHEACGDDAELQARVEGLLAAHDEAAGCVQETVPLSPEIEAELARLKPEEAGDVIGPYKLREQIGEGGFGSVWLAEQMQPVRRRVALKIIKLGMGTKEVIARFEQERQALALMDHPNIAKVFDAGATQVGRPFFVMELVRGVTITEFCDEKQLSTAERLELFVAVCQAVQHAHQKGIIHRDLKPSNILVTTADGKAVVKVIDFGVAKATQGRLTDASVYTQFQQMIGTPLYMSPEQAGMTSLDIDTRSDIYALGVLLYELLVGRLPFEADELMKRGLDEMRRMIREQEPPRPSQALHTMAHETLSSVAQNRASEPPRLVHTIRGDLDWIVMKCLEKDRGRRYETASGLAMDIQRHLDHEPIVARPPSTGYRLQKLIRRNRLVFAASAAVLAALIVGLGLSTVLFFKEREAHRRSVAAEAEQSRLREKAEQADAQSREEAARRARLLYAADVALASEIWQSPAGTAAQVNALLEAHRPKDGAEDRRETAWRLLWHQLHRASTSTFRAATGPLRHLALTSEGPAVTMDPSHMLREWDPATGQMRAQRQLAAPADTELAALSPDGRRVAFASKGGAVQIVATSLGGSAQSRPAASGEPLLNLAFSPEGKWLSGIGIDGKARVWDAATGAEAQTFALQRTGESRVVTLLPDGLGLLVANHPGNSDLALYRAGESEPLVRKAWGGTISTVTCSFDGQFVVAGGVSGHVGVWELPSFKESERMRLVTGAITSMAASPDRRQFAAGTEHGEVVVFTVSPLQIRALRKGHMRAVRALAFTANGKGLASADDGGIVRFWQLDAPAESRVLRGSGIPNSATFSRDGRWLLAGGGPPEAGVVTLWDTRSWTSVRTFGTAAPRGTFAPPVNGQEPPPPAAVHSVVRAIFSPDGETVATAGRDGRIKLWARETGAELRTLTGLLPDPVASLAFSPDGRWLAAGFGFLNWFDDRRIGAIKVWEAASGREIATLKGHERSVASLAFSPAGETLASTSHDGTVRLWRVADWQETGRLGTSFAFKAVAFSPDGTTLAASTSEGPIVFWEVASQRELRRLVGHSGMVWDLAFSPDARTLVSSGRDRSVRLWDVGTGRQLSKLPGESEAPWPVAFSPDGRTLVTPGDGRGPLRLWQVPALRECGPAHQP